MVYPLRVKYQLALVRSCIAYLSNTWHSLYKRLQLPVCWSTVRLLLTL